MKDGLLEVGDRLYCHLGERWHIVTVKRVTKTQAIAGGFRVNREYSDGTTEVGRYKSFYLVTPEIDAQVNTTKQYDYIREFFLSNNSLTPEHISQVYHIVKGK